MRYAWIHEHRDSFPVAVRPTAMGWVNLAVILDLFSRKVVSWEIPESLATPVVSSPLPQAIECRSPNPGELLHHRDRGRQ